MEKEVSWMEKLFVATGHVGPDVLIWAGERSSPNLAELRSAERMRASAPTWPVAIAGLSACGVYAVFFSTSAEFFDPNPTQLQIARSI